MVISCNDGSFVLNNVGIFVLFCFVYYHNGVYLIVLIFVLLLFLSFTKVLIYYNFSSVICESVVASAKGQQMKMRF